jgi:cell division protein FtsQ
MTARPVSGLKQRVSLLERKKRRILYRDLWRSGFVTFFTTGLLLMASLPYWQIQQRFQVQIEGNKLVSKDTIYAILGLTKSQYIWNIPNQILAKKIETMASIEAAKVSKQIFPPRLIVLVKERQPVALASSIGKVGLLDSQGVWIPLDLYDRTQPGFKFPRLKVVNFKSEDRSGWSQIYRLISLYSAIKVDEVRWDGSANLFLKTEIGTIYLGSDLSKLPQQFKTLARLKNLPNYLEIGNVDYIDLSNPDFELIQKYHP